MASFLHSSEWVAKLAVGRYWAGDPELAAGGCVHAPGMGCSGDVGVRLCSAPWLGILLSCGNLWLFTSITNQGAENNPKRNVQLRLVTEEPYYPLDLDLCALPLLRSCKSTVTTPLQHRHRWEVATWLCLPFTPHKSVLLARCLPLTGIQTIVRASISTLC